jgi:hypothetical protein
MAHHGLVSSVPGYKLSKSDEIVQLIEQAKRNEQSIDQGIEETLRLLPKMKEAVRSYQEDDLKQQLNEHQHQLKKQVLDSLGLDCSPDILGDMERFSEWMVKKCEQKRAEEEEVLTRKESLVKQKRDSCELLVEERKRLEALKRECDRIKETTNEEKKQLKLLVHLLDLSYRDMGSNQHITIGKRPEVTLQLLPNSCLIIHL